MFRLTFLILISLATSALPAFATTHTDIGFRENSNIFSGCSDGGFGAGSQTVSISCNSGTNFGDARARASYGSLGTEASISSTSTNEFNGDYQAFALANFDDFITISSSEFSPASDPLGRRYVSIDLHLEGTGGTQGPLFGEPGSAFNFPSLTVTLGFDENEGRSIGGGVRRYEFFVNINDPVRMEVELISDVRCFGCDLPYNIYSNQYGTATFMGFDVEGYTRSQFSVTSSDNQSYGNVVPVPEPSTALLQTSALLALLGLAGKRK
jgi:hypothetical protein